MRLTVLGSGTNVHPTRAAAGYLVETDQLLLFDFGPRTLMNLITVGVDRQRLRHIFFTHHHTDHFADFLTFFFDAVVHAKFVAPRPGLTIYGPRGTRRLFATLRPGANHMHAGDCGRVAREAGVKRLVLSHFYPVAERYDVVAQAGRTFGGRITMARDRMRITLPSRAAPKSR